MVGRLASFLPQNPNQQVKTHNPVTNLDSGKKNLDSNEQNLDSGDISRRFDEILTGSSEISLNPVKLSPNLAKSHRF